MIKSSNSRTLAPKDNSNKIIKLADKNQYPNYISTDKKYLAQNRITEFYNANHSFHCKMHFDLQFLHFIFKNMFAQPEGH